MFCNYLFFTFSGHVMGPPLRPDPTTPGFLMDLLAKWVLLLLAFILLYFLLSNSWQNLWKTFESWLHAVWQPVFRQPTHQRPLLNYLQTRSKSRFQSAQQSRLILRKDSWPQTWKWNLNIWFLKGCVTTVYFVFLIIVIAIYSSFFRMELNFGVQITGKLQNHCFMSNWICRPTWAKH